MMPDFEHVPEQVDAAFTVTDESSAQWALRKYAYYSKRIATTDELASKEIERVQEWREITNKPLVESALYFENLLADYARRVREVDPQIKSVHLPAGTIATRAVKGRIDISDDDALIVWAAANAPDVVVTKQTVSKTALGKLTRDGEHLVTADGEIVPDVTVGADSIRVQITPAESGGI